jgi:hypothetical protein
VADVSECAYLSKFVSNGLQFIVVLSALEVVTGLFWGRSIFQNDDREYDVGLLVRAVCLVTTGV